MVVIVPKTFTTRRQDIERAKGLAILFVVFGHIVARADPLDVNWYEPLRRAVYAFHMPFFLYLSGIVAVYSGALFTPPRGWKILLTARARRLLIPFFALGIFIVCGKMLTQRLMFVDNHTGNFWTGLTDLVWHTRDSPAGSVWYLFALFTLSIVSPILIWADRGRLRYLLIVTALIYCVPIPAFLYLDQIGKYAIFFALGAWAARQGEGWIAFMDRHWRILLLLFFFALAMIVGFGKYWPVRPDLLFVGTLSLPALHGLVRHLSATCASILLWLGQNCFMIYLFNTICIGISKGLLLRFTSWDGPHFLFFAAVLMLSGTLGPVLLKQSLFRHVAVLERYTA